MFFQQHLHSQTCSRINNTQTQSQVLALTFDQLLQKCLPQRSAFNRVSTRAQLVKQQQRAAISFGAQRGDPAAAAAAAAALVTIELQAF